MIENKQVMAENINHYMALNNVTATDVCKACGFKQNTFSDWVNAKTYPRIDKIERMAEYFHISKAALVEAPILVDYKPDNPTEVISKVVEYCKNLYPDSNNEELYDKITQAIDLYDRYNKASSDRQSMVTFALRSSQSDS